MTDFGNDPAHQDVDMSEREPVWYDEYEDQDSTPAVVEADDLESDQASSDEESKMSTDMTVPDFAPIASEKDTYAAIARRAFEFDRTERGVAERIAAYSRGTIRYRTEIKVWSIWSGKVWEIATTAEMTELYYRYLRVARKYETQIADVLGDERAEKRLTELRAQKELASGDANEVKRLGRLIVKAEAEADAGPGESHDEFLAKYESTQYANAIVNHSLPGIPGMAVKEEALDADDRVINTQDGILDLRTGIMGPHDPDALCTKITRGSGRLDVPMTDDLKAVLENLSRDASGNIDTETMDFIGWFAGVGMTGLNPRMFLWTYGASGTGKSTLWESLFHAMGGEESSTYARSLAPKIFMASASRAGDTADPMLNKLHGIRFLLLDEAEGVVDAARLKAISGGASMDVRGLHESGRILKPKCSMAWTSQFPIRVSSGDDVGVQARHYPINTQRPIGDKQVDSVRERLTQTQEAHDSILAWALGYAIRFIRDLGGESPRIPVPESMKAARESYKSTASPISDWTEDAIVQTEWKEGDKPESTLTTADAHTAYVDWSKSRGMVRPQSLKMFTLSLVRQGYILSAPQTKRTVQGQKVRGTIIENAALIDPNEDF